MFICGPQTRSATASWWLFALVGFAALVLASPLSGASSRRDLAQVLAFTRADGIYTMRIDGSAVRPIRRGGVAALARDLNWSPDGRRLAFSAGSGIWTMNADGTGLVRLVDAWPGAAQSPSWSPDGRKLAFATFKTETGGRLWVVNANGKDRRLLAKLPRLHLYGVDVDWSPAGGRIAFTTGGWTSQLYVLNSDGSGLRKLANAAMTAYEPQWSPDGRQIAFTDAPSASREEIALIAVDSEAGTQFLTSNELLDKEPAWSPDGSRIAFVRGKEEPCSLSCPPLKHSTHEIYLMNANGTGVIRLTHNGIGEGSPAWQPVGTR